MEKSHWKLSTVGYRHKKPTNSCWEWIIGLVPVLVRLNVFYHQHCYYHQNNKLYFWRCSVLKSYTLASITILQKKGCSYYLHNVIYNHYAVIFKSTTNSPAQTHNLIHFNTYLLSTPCFLATLIYFCVFLTIHLIQKVLLQGFVISVCSLFIVMDFSVLVLGFVWFVLPCFALLAWHSTPIQSADLSV